MYYILYYILYIYIYIYYILYNFEVLDLLRGQSNDKATGMDGLSGESLKFADPILAVLYYRVFSPVRERADNLSLIKKPLFLHSFYEITKQ